MRKFDRLGAFFECAQIRCHEGLGVVVSRELRKGHEHEICDEGEADDQ